MLKVWVDRNGDEAILYAMAEGKPSTGSSSLPGLTDFTYNNCRVGCRVMSGTSVDDRQP